MATPSMTWPHANAGGSGRLAVPAARSAVPFAAGFVLFFIVVITVFGKGPTYLFYPPIYWAEVALAAGLLWGVNKRGFAGLFLADRSTLTYAVLCFTAIAALRLTTSLEWGFLNALQDFAAFYYALFYFVGFLVASDERLGEAAWRWFAVAWLLAMFWGTADQLSGLQLAQMGPVLPWRGVPLLWNSNYEMVQHLGLGAILVSNRLLHRGMFSRFQWLLTPCALFAGAVAMASHGRAVKAGLILGGGVAALFLFAPGRKLRMSHKMIVAAVLAVLISVAALPQIDGGPEKFLQAFELDRFSADSFQKKAAEADWRFVWWGNLVKEVAAEAPWLGLGFGYRLFVHNPYIPPEEMKLWPTRSPHNYNLTVVARTGLLGTLAWVTILAAGLGGLFKRAWRGVAYSPERREEIVFWIVMLLVTWFNASLGVLMEGPVLGVWFWFALGFAWRRSMSSGNSRNSIGSSLPQQGSQCVS